MKLVVILLTILQSMTMVEIPLIFGPFPQFKPMDYSICEGISVYLGLNHSEKGCFTQLLVFERI